MANYFIERHAGGERALLVQIHFYRKTPPNALDEFRELADSANVTTLQVVTANMSVPNPKYFIGKGKAEEIAALVAVENIEVVLFNHALTPGQGRNLEQLFHCRVIDRTELILDIFAQRARTFEGKLQVELAQLQHLRTCLVRGWTHLERQKGGIGLRGPGETQLETDRRLLDQRIRSITKRLTKVSSQRAQGRRARTRADVSTVSLVGYTNAGKSTLFNRLTASEIYTADQLFATLDPTLRQLSLPKLGTAILADTVGFIRDLPHDLVAAFKATLEETREATLLLHVLDASSEDADAMRLQVEKVLAEIDAEDVPSLLVCNKIDKKEGFIPRIDYDAEQKPWRVWVSALTGAGIDLLLKAIDLRLAGQIIQRRLILNPDQGKLRAALYALNAVVDEQIDEQGRHILQLEIRQSDYLRLCRPSKH